MQSAFECAPNYQQLLGVSPIRVNPDLILSRKSQPGIGCTQKKQKPLKKSPLEPLIIDSSYETIQFIYFDSTGSTQPLEQFSAATTAINCSGIYISLRLKHIPLIPKLKFFDCQRQF
jgi:hypothetical protein